MSDDIAVEIDVAGMRDLVRRLEVCVRALEGVAGGLDRAVPAVPEDEHGLAGKLIAMDEARERFDRSLAATLDRAGGRLSLVTSAAEEADRTAADQISRR